MERKEARRAVLQARQQGLEAAREAAFAASRRSDVTAELEAALLPGSPHASKGPGGKSPSDSGCLPGEDGSSRDARSLWQRVRRGLGEAPHACKHARGRTAAHAHVALRCQQCL